MLEVLRLVPRRDRTLTGARNRENTASPIFFVKIEGAGGLEVQWSEINN